MHTLFSKERTPSDNYTDDTILEKLRSDLNEKQRDQYVKEILTSPLKNCAARIQKKWTTVIEDYQQQAKKQKALIESHGTLKIAVNNPLSSSAKLTKITKTEQVISLLITLLETNGVNQNRCDELYEQIKTNYTPANADLLKSLIDKWVVIENKIKIEIDRSQHTLSSLKRVSTQLQEDFPLLSTLEMVNPGTTLNP